MRCFIATMIFMLSGKSYRYIAEQLNNLNVATAKGGRWFASTVRNYDMRAFVQ